MLRLVVDTNVIIGSLIRNSTTRFILLNPGHIFYVPEYAIEEVNKHMEMIVAKSGLKLEQVKLVFDIILEHLEIIPMSDIQTNLEKAVKILQSDEKDVPFLALALTIPCDGIWTNDEHFKNQDLVKIWNTNQVLQMITGGTSK